MNMTPWNSDMKIAFCRFISLCLFLAICSANNISAEPYALKVGVIAPLSGAAAVYGNAIKNGLDFYVHEHGPGFVKYIYEDDQFVTSKTVAAYHKLVEVDKVDVLISIASTQTAAIAPLAEKRGIPLIGWASDDRISKGRRWIVRSGMSGFAEGKKAAEEALKKGYQRSGVIISTNDYSDSVRRGFLAKFPKERVLVNEEFLPEERDYRAFIAKLKSLKLDSLYFCINAGSQAIFAKQVKQITASIKLCGCENLHDLNEVKNSDAALIGAWFVTAPVSDAFRKKYVEYYHNDDLISGAAIHYDIAEVLEDFAATGRKTTELIPYFISLGERNGAIGKYRMVKENDDQFFEMELIAKEILADGFRVLN